MNFKLKKRAPSRRSKTSPRPRSPKGEAIQMDAKRFWYFPQTFTWRGQRYEVHAVVRCWTISRRFIWDVQRHYFQVRCAEGVFELYQDVKTDTWHISRFEKA